jgi:hypothetical protein
VVDRRWLQGCSDTGQVEADGLIVGCGRNVPWFGLEETSREGFTDADRVAFSKGAGGFRVVVGTVRIDLELVGRFQGVWVDLGLQDRVVFRDA